MAVQSFAEPALSTQAQLWAWDYGYEHRNSTLHEMPHYIDNQIYLSNCPHYFKR